MEIILGDHRNKQVAFDMHAALNQHMLVLGKTGGGKSVECQKIITEIVKKGGTVVAFDFHQTLSDDQIFAPYKQEFNTYKNDIDAYNDGIKCELFKPIVFSDGSEEAAIDTVGAVLGMIKETLKLGSKQQSTLRCALTYVMETGTYDNEGFMAIDHALENIETTQAETVREKLYQLTAHNVFRPGSLFIENEKVNIIRLSKFDTFAQEMIIEAVLSYIWRLAMTGKFKERGLFIFLDEYQNLPSGKECALAKILAEGRRFNTNLILATQQLLQNSTSVVQQRVLQCGLSLFFQPNTGHAGVIARLIDPFLADQWSLVLRTLKKGEFVALGTLKMEGRAITKPLKVSARVTEDMNCNEEECIAEIPCGRGSISGSYRY